MSELKASDLTAEEIYAATENILKDPLLHKFFNWALGCAKASALFAPAQPEPKREETGEGCRKCKRSFLVGEDTCPNGCFAPPPAPVADTFATDRAIGAEAIDADTAPVAGELAEAVFSGVWMPTPEPQDLATIIGMAVHALNGEFAKATVTEIGARLERAWRNSSQATAQPMAVGMTPEMNDLCESIMSFADCDPDTQVKQIWRKKVAAVRAQAASAQPKATARDLGKVRECLAYFQKTLAAARGGWSGYLGSLMSTTTSEQLDAALAELDAQPVRGKVP